MNSREIEKRKIEIRERQNRMARGKLYQLFMHLTYLIELTAVQQRQLADIETQRDQTIQYYANIDSTARSLQQRHLMSKTTSRAPQGSESAVETVDIEDDQ